MKRVNYCLTILIVLGVCSIAPLPVFADSWEFQNSPTSLNLNNVVFLDSSIGWAVGDSGTILHTTDGGVIWAIQASGTTVDLQGLDFAEENHGWAVGSGVSYDSTYNIDSCWNVIMRTTNGGESWITQVSDTGYVLNAVDFVDANNGWAIGYPGKIIHTTDGGGSWTAQNSGTTNSLSDVVFTDGSNGWVVGIEGTIVHTTDGGGSWTIQNNDLGYSLSGVTFANENIGWAAGGRGGLPYEWRQIMLHTTDGGNTWTAQLDDHGKPLGDLTFVDMNNGWKMWSWMIDYTTNGGGSWTSEFVGGNILTRLAFADTNNGWAVGYGGVIVHTTNGGISWIAPDENALPTEFSLSQNYPNPFNARTTIRYSLPMQSEVAIDIFDILGRKITQLAEGAQEPGNHKIIWDATGIPTGIYFYRLTAGDYRETKRMLLLK